METLVGGAVHTFVVLTDQNLEYLQTAKRLEQRQAIFFTWFNFTISYRSASKNIKADALSFIYTEEPKSVEPEGILPESCFMEKLAVTVSLKSRYHPQANGQVERVNQKVRRFLGSLCAENQFDWARFLPWAESAQNSLRHSLQTSLHSSVC